MRIIGQAIILKELVSSLISFYNDNNRNEVALSTSSVSHQYKGEKPIIITGSITKI